MNTALFMYDHGRLKPASPRAKEELRQSRLKDGDLVAVKIIKSRNPKLCGLAQVVFDKVGEAIGVSAAAVEAQLKLALGYVDVVEKADGSRELSPRRMDFESVPDEVEFTRFWQEAEALICEKLLPSIDANTREEIFGILEGRGNGRMA